MRRRQFTAAALTLPLGTLITTLRAQAQALSSADAALGIRSALERGAQAAVSSLGRTDGFFANPKVKIPLPKPLEQASKLLRLTGQQQRVDDLVLAMNRAAEAAVPKAQTLLVQAAKSMTVNDALGIVRGGNTSVTDFFARKTRDPLTTQFLPIVNQATAKVDLATKYNSLAGKAQGVGLIKSEDADIDHYVTRKALDGLYFMIGEEEQKIRRDPLGTGSELLKRVFG